MTRKNADSRATRKAPRILPTQESAHQRLLAAYEPANDGSRTIDASADPVFLHLWNHIASNSDADDEPEEALESATRSIVDLASMLRRKHWAEVAH